MNSLSLSRMVRTDLSSNELNGWFVCWLVFYSLNQKKRRKKDDVISFEYISTFGILTYFELILISFTKDSSLLKKSDSLKCEKITATTTDNRLLFISNVDFNN